MHLKSDSLRPCFVVGCPRSGTTLLSVMLDRHPELAILPETAFYDEIAPRLTREINLHDVLNTWPRLADLGLSADAICQRVGKGSDPRDVFTAILELYAQSVGKPRVGEKTPTHLRHVPALMNDFPAGRVVCLVRDGRNVALSLRSMPWFGGDLAAGAHEWLKAAHHLQLFGKTYPRRFLVVRYEELIASPHAVLQQVMPFLGLRFHSDQLSTERASKVIRPQSLPWKRHALERVDVALAGAKRFKTDPADIKFLNERMREELLRLGYPVP